MSSASAHDEPSRIQRQVEPSAKTNGAEPSRSLLRSAVVLSHTMHFIATRHQSGPMPQRSRCAAPPCRIFFPRNGGAGPPRTWTCARLAFARDVNATSLARPLHHRGSVDSVYNCSPFGGSRLNDHFILAVADIHCPVLSRRAPDDLVLRVRPPRCPRTPEGDGGAGCAEEARADGHSVCSQDRKAPSPLPNCKVSLRPCPDSAGNRY